MAAPPPTPFRRLLGVQPLLSITSFDKTSHRPACDFCEKEFLDDELLVHLKGDDPRAPSVPLCHKDCWLAKLIGHPMPTDAAGITVGKEGMTPARAEIQALYPDAVGKEIDALKNLHITSPVFIKNLPPSGPLGCVHLQEPPQFSIFRVLLAELTRRFPERIRTSNLFPRADDAALLEYSQADKDEIVRLGARVKKAVLEEWFRSLPEIRKLTTNVGVHHSKVINIRKACWIVEQVINELEMTVNLAFVVEGRDAEAHKDALQRAIREVMGSSTPLLTSMILVDTDLLFWSAESRCTHHDYREDFLHAIAHTRQRFGDVDSMIPVIVLANIMTAYPRHPLDMPVAFAGDIVHLPPPERPANNRSAMGRGAERGRRRGRGAGQRSNRGGAAVGEGKGGECAAGEAAGPVPERSGGQRQADNQEEASDTVQESEDVPFEEGDDTSSDASEKAHWTQRLEEREARMEVRWDELDCREAEYFEMEAHSAQLREREAREMETLLAQLREREAQLEAREAQLRKREAQLEAREAHLREREAQWEARGAELRELEASMRVNTQA